MPSKYLYRVQARRNPQQGSSVQTGLQVGQEVGKLIGGLAGAIHASQMDAAANKLMNTENAPRAALVNPGGQTVTDDGSGDGSAPATQDLGQLPPDQPQTFTNPATGNVEPLQGQQNQDLTIPDSSGSGPTVGSLADSIGAAKAASSLSGGPQPAAQSQQPSDSDLLNAMNAPAQQPSSQPTSRFVANTIPAGVSTAGTQPFSGGVAGMKMQQEFQKSQMADQLQKLQLQRAQRDASSAADEDAGTGRFAIDAAQKRANLERTLAENAQIGKPKAGKEVAPDVPVGQEPLVNDADIAKHFPSLSKSVGADDSSVDTTSQPGYAVFGPKKVMDPNNPSSTVIDPAKAQKVPIADAQIYFKQLNARRKVQGLPLLKVPGEAQTLGPMIGFTADNPYPVQNNLDALSRAKDTFIRLPNGQVKQVP